MKVFYVDTQAYNEDALVKAWRKTVELVKQDKNIKTITFLVGQQRQYEMLLPLGFSKNQISSQGFRTTDGYNIQFRTLKTYHPDNVFVSNAPSEILVSIYNPSKNLYPFEDYSNIAYWVIVPWIMEENASFLSVHEAEDCETGISYPAPRELDGRVANAIDWLKETSYPNEGYHHPNDENRLKNIAVKLKKMRISVEYDLIVYYCLNHGFIPSAARKTADYIMRAQSHPMQIRDPYGNLESIINAPRD